MIETKAVAPVARGSGRQSNFSISGKETSTCGSRVARSAAIIAGRRWIVCGPKTRSTNGARARMPSPSWLATQPPTPMTSPGLLRFSSRHWPRWEKTFSCAFSRTEQVFSRTTSASSGLPVSASPADSRSTSAIRAESYSFIWQPKVEM